MISSTQKSQLQSDTTATEFVPEKISFSGTRSGRGGRHGGHDNKADGGGGGGGNGKIVNIDNGRGVDHRLDNHQASQPTSFVPEKISLNRVSSPRDGHVNEDGGVGPGGESENTIDAGQRLDKYQASEPSAISSSVVFHEETDLDLDDVEPLVNMERKEVASDPKTSGHDGATLCSPNQRLDSHQAKLFDEIDELFPHDYEGGKLVSDPDQPNHNPNTSASKSAGNDNNKLRRRSDSLTSSKSITSSLLDSLQKNSSVMGDDMFVPTDYDSLVRSSNDGTLAQLIAGIENRFKASTNLSRSITENIIGNEEAGIGSSNRNQKGNVSNRRESIVGGILAAPLADECVDWSSLLKSCKRAKNAFRDTGSSQMVVKYMFLRYLGPLISVLEQYCGSNDLNDGSTSWDEIKARTTETKRALRFAMTCLVPSRVEEGSKSVPETPTGLTEAQDDVENYRFARSYRQELQEAAVKGLTSRSSSHAQDEEMDQQTESRHYGLQLPLGEIIVAAKSVVEDDTDQSAYMANDNNHAALMSSIERGNRTVRILAARLLCNLVTDNPLAAEIIKRDVPFSPMPDEINGRMSGLILGSRESVSKTPTDGDQAIFWCDLFDATAKVGADDDVDDREALAAVAAALHNLLTSLEARESLLELDDEMKRREIMRHQKELQNDSADTRDDAQDETKMEHCSTQQIDVSFEVASNGPLMNALLRNILPAKAVLMQSRLEKEHATASRPTFKTPTSLAVADDLSDSATEWISLVLERLASRGLLPQMLQTTGGTTNSVTPEKVVLASCIRQAVDEYHSALTSSGDAGGFGRRRLSIAAKTTGITVMTRPHPLWGRADNICAGGRTNHGRDARTAVPVLLSLANEAEEIRLRANALRGGKCNELYDGEQNCSIRLIDDICDILAQSLGRHASSSVSATNNSQRSKLCFIAESRSILGRETGLVASCCKDLARVLDAALARNSGKKAREMELSPQDQQTAIVMVRLIANLIYQCRYNQDLIRTTPIPIPDIANCTTSSSKNAAGTQSNSNTGFITERTGLHVILSATSLAPACFTLREWCIVAIRNAVEGNAANAETVRRLEANQALGDTPELQRMGVKVDMDERGNISVKRRDS